MLVAKSQLVIANCQMLTADCWLLVAKSMKSHLEIADCQTLTANCWSHSLEHMHYRGLLGLFFFWKVDDLFCRVC